jgi:twinkle protein
MSAVWSDIEYKGTQKGEKKTICPNCSHTRSNKTDKCLAVNFDTGVGFCHHCEWKAFRDPIGNGFTLPIQDWYEHSQFSDKMLEFINARGISEQTLKDLCITEELFYQPQHKKAVNNIVFNYFEGHTLVNKKYRSGAKAFTQSKDTKSIFYNINAAIGKKEVYIVEGEFDVLAMYEAGFKNVISVPNGANDNDKYWINSEKYIKGVERFIIAVDTDDKGQKLRDEIAHRLGRYKCSYIEWENKDANGDLIAGVIQDSIRAKKTFPVKGINNPSDFLDDVIELYRNGIPKTLKPSDNSFSGLNNIFSLLEGQLTVITGIPSHGKSSWLEWYVLNLMKDYNFSASFFSPEHSPTGLHLVNFTQKILGSNFWGEGRMKESDVHNAMEWLKDRLKFMSPDKGDTPTWEWLMASFNEQVYAYGTKIFVIDAFNKLILPKGNKLDEISTVLTKLTAFAQSNDVLIFLVAHPTKMQLKEDGSYREPTLYDVAGSADFRNQTHNGLCIHRTFSNENTDGFTTVRNLKTKFSFQGEIGQSVDYQYDLVSGRYNKVDYPLNRSSLIGGKVSTSSMFDIIDDVDF